MNTIWYTYIIEKCGDSMDDISLFPHNEEGYKALINGLEDDNFAFLERATGTGKSPIMIKYLANNMIGKRVLWVTMHDAMFNQLVNRDMPSFHTSKDLYEKLDCVLYSSLPKHDANWYFENYDCFIFDEAHHCGASKWGEVVAGLRDLVTLSDDKKMIGITATGIRYLDDYMDVAKEYFNGNVVSRLSISEAILKEILPAPFYVNFNRNYEEELLKVETKLYRLRQYHELDGIREQVRNLRKTTSIQYNIGNLMKNYDIKSGEKYIVFCKDIDDLIRKIEEVKYWFKDIDDIKVYDVHSGKKNSDNQKEINKFETDDSNSLKIMLAVDMFNEGLHIKNVDGIFMLRKTSSPILYLQQLGRVLSFASRKKQVKVFDLAGNATSIDIIYNLYKELLTETKEKIKEEKDNVGYYEKIVNRFKIIEEGTEVIDSLTRINEFLDDNYFNKENIKKYINILKIYCENLSGNFMYLLKNHQIDKEHLAIYRNLQKLADKLTIDDFLELNRLGIIIINAQTDDEELEKIKKYGSLKKARDIELDTFMKEYNSYYIIHNERNNQEDIVLKYRNILSSINYKVLNKYLKDANYPLNIEEKLLLRDFPEKEEIDAYLEMIKHKYLNGIELDMLEERSLNMISRIISLKEYPELKSILDNKVLQIDGYLKILKEYLDEHPDEYLALNNSVLDERIKKALRNLHKYAIYVTNKQFELLLELNIELPKKINMTYEKRKELLGEYQSFYEKEEAFNKISCNKIKEFIKKNKRRPDEVKESELYKKYQTFFEGKTSYWTKVITNTLEENDVTLTLDEKIVSNSVLNQDELSMLYDKVMEEIKNGQIDNFEYEFFVKKIRILKKSDFIDEGLFKILLRTATLINYLNGNNHEYQKEMVKRYLHSNQSIIPYHLISYIYENYGIYLSNVKSEENAYLNIAERRYRENIKKRDLFLEYVRTYHKRPEENSKESHYIRDYLASASSIEIKKYISTLNNLGIPLSIEELYLNGDMSLDEAKELYSEIILKRRQNERMDKLDVLLYKKLNPKFYHNGRDDSIHDLNKELKKKTMFELKKEIAANPRKELDFKDIYLLESEKEELKEYRMILLGKIMFQEMINKLVKTKKTLRELLNEEEMQSLEELIIFSEKKQENLDLINEINRINRKNTLENNHINVQDFINEYLLYIKNNGKEPQMGMDIESDVLVRKYLLIKDVMTKEEKSAFSSMVKKSLSGFQKEDFYDDFVSFIKENERFPSAIGDTPFEIDLAEKYQIYGNKLDKEKRQVINRLLKKCQMNTIRYFEKKKEIFYQEFVSFIKENERFPLVKGDNPFEIDLAKKYQIFESKLDKEKRQEINDLLKKYQINSIQYFEKKKGR